jgi:2-keto-4-pentenoate hydratase/2-oxohepta-3-ene-1,7-dioic acid hydratase in catechol pathway
MRLYTFEVNGEQCIGAEQNRRLIDLRAAHCRSQRSIREREVDLLSGLKQFLAGGPDALQLARQALDHATLTGEPISYALDEVKILAPIPRPGKILCSGVNYQGHLEENPAATLPETPFFFSKLPTAVIGPGRPIVLPRMSKQVDYEVELAVVIGRTMRHTPESQAMSCVAGYTILHDVSARDVQFKDQQITLGKNFDTFAPMGPCLVTPDELPDPANLRLRTSLNGQAMQDGTTRDWVFPLPYLLSFLSQVMTLEPGDIVTTGTPAGVGAFRKPPVYLQPGDVVALEIEGIGRLENMVVGE